MQTSLGSGEARAYHPVTSYISCRSGRSQHSGNRWGPEGGTMQSTTRYALSIILLSSVVSSSYHSSAKLRRDGILNLYPFPRVGRAGSTWQINDPDTPAKRQLYAFPRVGRSHSDYQLSPQLEELLFGRRNPYMKRQSFEQMEGKDSSGMWFGPRLGRSFRSADDDISQSDNDKSESEQLENTNMDREKRQTQRT